MSSPSLSVRLVTLDHYSAKPIRCLQSTYDGLSTASAQNEPVLRIYGPTSSGEKACVHVHGVYPYLYVPYDGGESPERDCMLLAASLDKALQSATDERFRSSNQRSVQRVVLVSGIPFYGYHTRPRQFLKIYFFNPYSVRKASEVLLSGAVLNMKLQPHESHIPFTLQFMIDFNLYGMSFVNLAKVKYRRNPTNPETLAGIEDSLLLPEYIKKISHSAIEVDVLAEDILNRTEEQSVAANPGLAGIWAEERLRRRQAGRESQPTPQSTQARTHKNRFGVEVDHLRELQIRIKELEAQMDAEKLPPETPISEPRTPYPAEIPENTDILDASIIDIGTDHYGTTHLDSEEALVNESIIHDLTQRGLLDSEDEHVESADERDEDEGDDGRGEGLESDDAEAGLDMTQPLHLPENPAAVPGDAGESYSSDSEDEFWREMAEELFQLDGAGDSSDSTEEQRYKLNTAPNRQWRSQSQDIPPQQIVTPANETLANWSNNIMAILSENNCLPVFQAPQTFWEPTVAWESLAWNSQNTPLSNMQSPSSIFATAVPSPTASVLSPPSAVLTPASEMDRYSDITLDIIGELSDLASPFQPPDTPASCSSNVQSHEVSSQINQEQQLCNDPLTNNDVHKKLATQLRNFIDNGGIDSVNGNSLNLKQYLKRFGDVVKVDFKIINGTEMVVIEYKTPRAGKDAKNKFIIKPLFKFVEEWYAAESKLAESSAPTGNNPKYINGFTAIPASEVIPKTGPGRPKKNSDIVHADLHLLKTLENKYTGDWVRNNAEYQKSKFIVKSLEVMPHSENRSVCNESVNKRDVSNKTNGNVPCSENTKVKLAKCLKSARKTGKVGNNPNRPLEKSSDKTRSAPCYAASTQTNAVAQTMTSNRANFTQSYNVQNSPALLTPKKEPTDEVCLINSQFEEYYKNLRTVSNSTSSTNMPLRIKKEFEVIDLVDSSSDEEMVDVNKSQSTGHVVRNAVNTQPKPTMDPVQFVSQILSTYSSLPQSSALPPLSITVNIGDPSIPVQVSVQPQRLPHRGLDGPDDSSEEESSSAHRTRKKRIKYRPLDITVQKSPSRRSGTDESPVSGLQNASPVSTLTAKRARTARNIFSASTDSDSEVGGSHSRSTHSKPNPPLRRRAISNRAKEREKEVKKESLTAIGSKLDLTSHQGRVTRSSLRTRVIEPLEISTAMKTPADEKAIPQMDVIASSSDEEHLRQEARRLRKRPQIESSKGLKDRGKSNVDNSPGKSNVTSQSRLPDEVNLSPDRQSNITLPVEPKLLGQRHKGPSEVGDSARKNTVSTQSSLPGENNLKSDLEPTVTLPVEPETIPERDVELTVSHEENVMSCDVSKSESFSASKNIEKSPMNSSAGEWYCSDDANCSSTEIFPSRDIPCFIQTDAVYPPRTFTPRNPPPTRADIERSKMDFDMDITTGKKPFYSDYRDVTKQHAVGNKLLKIENYSCENLKTHKSEIIDNGIEELRNMVLGKDLLGVEKCALINDRSIVITPAHKPPTRKEVALWCSTRNISVTSDVIEVPKVKLMLPGGQESDSENESMTLTPCTPSVLSDNSLTSTPDLPLRRDSSDFSITNTPLSRRRASLDLPETPRPGPSRLTPFGTKRKNTSRRVSFDESVLAKSPSDSPTAPIEQSTPMREESPGLTSIAEEGALPKGPLGRLRGRKRLLLSKLRRTSSDSNKSKDLFDADKDSCDSTPPEVMDMAAEQQKSDHSISRVGRDNSCQIQGVTLDNTFGFKTSLQNLQDAKPAHDFQHITILTVEVLTETRGDLFPDPQLDAVLAIFFHLSHDAPSGSFPISETGLFTVGNPLCGTGINVAATCLPTEEDMLNHLILCVRRWDPDILAGYEMEKGSWGYILQRGCVLGLNILSQIGRTLIERQEPHVFDSTDDSDDVPRFVRQLKVPGRIILNIWRLLRKELALTSYTFENVMFHLLHERHPLLPSRVLSRLWKHKTPRARHIPAEHFLIRVTAIGRILEQLDLITRNSELARLFGIQFSEVLSRGSQFRVESMMLRMAKPRNLVAVSPSIEQRAHMRAPASLPLVMEPESQFYTDPVIVLDFQSLYPSMIIAYNYCFSTCLGRSSSLGHGDDPFEFGCTRLSIPTSDITNLVPDKIHISPAGIAFVSQDIYRGVLPAMLEEILDARLMVKKSMKQCKEDKVLQKMLHARQLGLKLIANVTYGYTSANFSGRMPCMEIADSVVSKGRETLQRAMRMVEGNERWRARVVYGDTDSLFVLTPGRTREEAFQIGEEIANAVTLDNPRPVKLKLEKVYQPCILQTKKRYVGNMYESASQSVPEFNAKGIETVRRDGCPAIAKILQKSLKLLFETSDISQVKRYTLRQFAKIFQQRVNIHDLVFAKEYRGRRGYRPGACVPALQLAKQWTAVDRRAEPRVKERVPYVIVHGAPGVPLIRLVRSPKDLMTDCSLRINAAYYITKAIIPPLQRCFTLLGADPLSWYSEMPRRYHRMVRSGLAEPRKRRTISQYFATIECVICGYVGTSRICSKCSEDPQKLAAVLSDKMRYWERGHSSAVKVCQSCCKRADYIDCESLDCPVLFRRLQLQQSAEQTSTIRNILAENLQF